jgi:cytochrome c oxidase assembly protein subunit 15
MQTRFLHFMPVPLARSRTVAYKPFLAWFCIFALCWTMCLLFAGGLTTSIHAGMAFLDWPLSNGSLNPDGWLTEADKRAEHSHRLLAIILGLLTITIAVWHAAREERRWVRRLAYAAALVVPVQGLLGGLRVLLDSLNTGWDGNVVAQSFATAHAFVAQVVLCVLVTIAVANTRRWIERTGGLQRAPSAALRRAGIVACAVVLVQLLLGAVMRHSQAWAMIPTFPFSTPDGGLLPAQWDFRTSVHFAHRAWAVVVTIALMFFAGRLWAARHVGRVLGAGALVITLLLGVQIWLGALIIWTQHNQHAATLHMLCGAGLLATCWGLALLCHRFRFPDAAASAQAHRTSGVGQTANATGA